MSSLRQSSTRDRRGSAGSEDVLFDEDTGALQLMTLEELNHVQFNPHFATLPHVHVEFSDAVYSVRDGRRAHGLGRFYILKNAFGLCSPGEVLAVLGESGSGKSSLLQALGGYRRAGKLQMHYTLGPYAITLAPQLQGAAPLLFGDSYLPSELTVREVIVFAAMLRLHDRSKAERLAFAESLIAHLNLKHIASHRIGLPTDTSRISGGERRRVSLGIEMASFTPLLLADEPTSGLDSVSAEHIVDLLRCLAVSRNVPVIASIHQPSWQIFRKFSKVLILDNGKTVFFGTPEDAISDLASCDLSCPRGSSLSDHLLAVTCSTSSASIPFHARHLIRQNSNARFEKALDESRECATVRRVSYHRRLGEAFYTTNQMPFVPTEKFGAPFSVQFQEILKRQFRLDTRVTTAFVGRLFLTAFTALLIAFTFFQLPLDQVGAVVRLSACFFIVLQSSFPSLQSSVASIQLPKELLRKELFENVHSLNPWFFSRLSLHIPFSMLWPLAFALPSYWIMGFQSSFVKFLNYYFTLFLVDAIAVSIGELVAMMSPNMITAQVISPNLLVLFTLYAGFLSATGDSGNGSTVGPLPVLSWIQHISFIKYAFDALVINEMSGLEFTCDDPPCHFQTGEEVLEFFDFPTYAYGLNWLYLIIIWIFLKISLYIYISFFLFPYSQRHYKYLTPGLHPLPVILQDDLRSPTALRVWESPPSELPFIQDDNPSPLDNPFAELTV